MANDGVENRDTSDNDDDDDACPSDDEEEEEETEYGSPDEVCDFLNNCSRRNLLKILLYYIKCQEGHISKIKNLTKTNLNNLKKMLNFENQMIHYQII